MQRDRASQEGRAAPSLPQLERPAENADDEGVAAQAGAGENREAQVRALFVLRVRESADAPADETPPDQDAADSPTAEKPTGEEKQADE